MAAVPEISESIVDRLASILARFTHSARTGWDADAVPTTPKSQIPADKGDAASRPNRGLP